MVKDYDVWAHTGLQGCYSVVENNMLEGGNSTHQTGMKKIHDGQSSDST